jgi:hypothetical protein
VQVINNAGSESGGKTAGTSYPAGLQSRDPKKDGPFADDTGPSAKRARAFPVPGAINDEEALGRDRPSPAAILAAISAPPPAEVGAATEEL